MTRKLAVCDVRDGRRQGRARGARRCRPARRGPSCCTATATSSPRSAACTRAAPDMNTSEHDMDTIAERCPYVFCRTVENGGSGSTSPATARGVFHGIEASVEYALEVAICSGVRVLVQGLGVGRRAARRSTSTRRARSVLVSDVDAAVAADARHAGRARGRDRAPSATCSRRARSAASINATTVERAALPRRSPAPPTTSSPTRALADRLHERGILYAPDYVINSGGVLHGAGLESLGWDEAMVEERLRGLGDTLLELYADDGARRSTPPRRWSRAAAPRRPFRSPRGRGSAAGRRRSCGAGRRTRSRRRRRHRRR